VALQNRVTPFGDVVALPGRGTLMGNRGILHDEARRVVRSFQVRRWIACELEFRGRTRTVMTPHRYTELFFLDEAAAFSAGHRPCAECRRGDFRRFADLWQRCGNGPSSADGIDGVLHAERLAGRTKRTYRAPAAELPDGTYVAWDDRAWLVLGREMLAWSDAGYDHRAPRPARGEIHVLTPPSTVRVFAGGYRPVLHSSARAIGEA
jgi:hypothetical protein